MTRLGTSGTDLSVAAERGTRASSPIDLIFVDVTAVAPLLEDAEAANRYLSPNDLSRAAERATHVQDGGVWRFGRIALRIALERHLGARFRGKEFEIESGGRPRVPGSAVQFSYSHSGRAALIAITEASPVGVDLEERRLLRMTAERQARIETAGAALAPGHPLTGDNLARGLQAWVRLEAAAKLYGRGIGDALTHAGVMGVRKPEGQRLDDQTRGRAAGVVVRDLQMPEGCDGYFAAIAAPHLPETLDAMPFPLTPNALQRFLVRDDGA